MDSLFPRWVCVAALVATGALTMAAPVIDGYSLALTESQQVYGQAPVTIKFDEYVSNPQPGGSPVNNGVIASFPGTFTGFVSPSAGNTTTSPLPAPVGVLVETSAGPVEFFDGTSSRVISDILGPRNGATQTYTFVDPFDPTRKAVVSRVAFRYGSTLGGNVTASFYDANDNPITVLPGKGAVPGATNTSDGYIATDNGAEVAVIHKAVLTGGGSDLWVVGSFAAGDPATLNDMAYNGVRMAARGEIRTMAFADIESQTVNGKAATAIKFDQYVPNTNEMGSRDSRNGTIATFSGPFTGFVSPSTDLPNVKDASNFQYYYGYDADPTNPAQVDLDGNGQGDFTASGGPTVSGGVATLHSGQWYASDSGSAGTDTSTIWPSAGINWTDGFTIDFRGKVLDDPAYPEGVRGSFAVIASASGTTAQPMLTLYQSGEAWGGGSHPHPVVFGSEDNTDGFHDFRMAQIPGRYPHDYWVWRDGVLLNPDGKRLNYPFTWSTVNHSRLYIGDLSGMIDGSVELESFSFTPGFFAPQPEPVGLLIESSTGEVSFLDATSGQVTSDIIGSSNGETLTLTFVDPANGTQKATVSRVGFRVGSTLVDWANQEYVTASFLDPEGDLLGMVGIPATVSGTPVGYMSMLDGVEASLIHQVVLRGNGSDLWVLGSFNAGSATELNDLVFGGFMIPEPGTLSLLALGGLGLMARRRRRAA